MRIELRRLVVTFLLGAATVIALQPIFAPRPLRAQQVYGRGIRHKFVSAVADGTDPTQIQPQRDWNDEHVLDRLVFGSGGCPASPPSNPVDGDIWVQCNGTSPSRVIAWKIEDNGLARTFAAVTY